ncbi:hypothetical protein XELAEV_18042731mg [Xenopus laevis]|uniref:Uncharacterized protein n=1 Tax=Xenopus laevis TaxID=8355 RepID=A0A974H6U2_XENLA|nr:hypothetical protein XELAEV_18042731mg [Xenopus laevis]
MEDLLVFWSQHGASGGLSLDSVTSAGPKFLGPEPPTSATWQLACCTVDVTEEPELGVEEVSALSPFYSSTCPSSAYP